MAFANRGHRRRARSWVAKTGLGLGLLASGVISAPAAASPPVAAQERGAEPRGALLAAWQPPASAGSQWEIQPSGPSARLQDEQNTIDVFQALAPATVFVNQIRRVRDFSMRALEVPAGTGSGFIWDRRGHIVTNYHVIASGERNTTYSVTLYNHKTYTARVVGGEPARDIAVLKIDAPAGELTPIRVRSGRASLAVGQKTVAIGNPFGLDHTLTTGVVSALGREIVGYGGITIRDMIQTDASINPGNSGGPLLDSSGYLIGMNTMIYSKSGSSAGIGFAVPVDTINRVVPQIIKFGKVKRAGLGISRVRDEIAASVGIRGVIIESVQRGSPAARAGLKGLRWARDGSVDLGDVIVGIDAFPIQNFDDLYNALERYKVGDSVAVKVQRDDKLVAVEVTLTALD